MTVEAATIGGFGVVARETYQVRAQGPFQLRRIRPGVSLGRTDDPGFGGLGLIDHARLQRGLVVKMHEHRNDEIISYLRSGRMQHTGSAGRSEVISPDRLMVMNAGAGFSHEEAVLGGRSNRDASDLRAARSRQYGCRSPVCQPRQNREHRSLAATGGAGWLGGTELCPPGHLPLRYPSVGGWKHRPADSSGVRSLAVCFRRRGIGWRQTSRNAYCVNDRRRPNRV